MLQAYAVLLVLLIAVLFIKREGEFIIFVVLSLFRVWKWNQLRWFFSFCQTALDTFSFNAKMLDGYGCNREQNVENVVNKVYIYL